MFFNFSDYCIFYRQFHVPVSERLAYTARLPLSLRPGSEENKQKVLNDYRRSHQSEDPFRSTSRLCIPSPLGEGLCTSVAWLVWVLLLNMLHCRNPAFIWSNEQQIAGRQIIQFLSIGMNFTNLVEYFSEESF